MRKNIFVKTLLAVAVLSTMYGCSSDNDEDDTKTVCREIEGDFFCEAEGVLDISEWSESSIEEWKRKYNDDGIVADKKLNPDYEDDFLKYENGDEANEEELRRIDVTVQSGDTFLAILSRDKINPRFFYNLPKKQQDYLISLNVGDEIYFKVDRESIVQEIGKDINRTTSISMKRNDKDRFDIEYDKGEIETQTNVYSFTINNNLSLDGSRAGLTHNAIGNLQNILGDRFSFNRDLRKGDRVAVMVQEGFYEGNRIGRQQILGVVLSTQRRGEIIAIRHESDDGSVGYFNEKGESSVTGFIRHPMQSYSRISSRFNPRRRHPITLRIRPHEGTDYAAPTGTPILAASDGVVEMARYNGGYGNVVYISHSNGIQTRYAHMHRLGVNRGQRVSKGQIIGTVGTTGASTGPHLHYEYIINGRAVDSLKVDLPLGDSLTGNELKKFNVSKSNIIAALTTNL